MGSVVDQDVLTRIPEVARFSEYGRATRVVGLIVEAVGLDVAMGELCRIHSLERQDGVLAEVVGFHGDGILLMPLGQVGGIHPGSPVEPLDRHFGIDVGPGLLGRVVDGMGRPIDGKGPIEMRECRPLAGRPPNPLERAPIEEPLSTGVRSLDGFLTLGRGQRVGIFAGSGVGKSTLLGMIARNASADVNVIALLGERGREVRDFIEGALGPDGLSRSVVVVATGDQSALVRARGASVATAIAEYFRDQGKHVLLMVDSVTRVATALREIGLAVGEPPTTKGYPPSVFAELPRLLERAGNASLGGITGIYTVLVEGDDMNGPVASHVRSVLDGHIVLSRSLASAGHFPAIDILESKSRLRDQVVPEEHLRAARHLQSLEAAYQSNKDLISVGAYEEGSDPTVDTAITVRPALIEFCAQGPREKSDFQRASRQLVELDRQAHSMAEATEA